MRDTGPVFIRKPADSPGIFKSDHPMKIFYNHPMKKFLKASLKLFGSVLFLAALWLLVGVLWPLAAPQAKQAPGRLLIKGATLVDVRSGELRPHQDILVESGEIIAVGNDLEPGDARLLQAQGQYVIPGMFDMHVHSIKLSPNLIHPLFVAAGVTAVRDMGGCIGIEDAWVACADEKRQWDRAVRESRMIGPRYDQVTSLAINGGQEIPGGEDRELGAPSPDGARMRVDFDRARTIDFLKPYTRIPRDSYFALAEAARANGLYLAGHKPLSVSGLEAIAAGQRSIEHAFLFIWECYPEMDVLRATGDPRAAYTDETRAAMLAEHDEGLCAALRQAMADAKTAFVPTHTTRKLDAFALDDAYRSDPRLTYIPAPLKFFWLNDADGMARRAGEQGQSSYLEFYRFGLEMTGAAHAAGVQILAGTDTPDSFAFPGTGLHDELDHLVQAGLSPLDALRAATLEPASFLGLEGKAGIIEPGARADLVLLSGNPLDDISAVRTTRTVVLAGTVYDRDDLDALLGGVEKTAGSWSIWPKFIWQMLNSPIMRRQWAD
jgi:imidazolonepropionase-like amidohydrolase